MPVPEAKAGEVLIKVEAASFNRADLSLRKGAYRISPDQLPVIPGREFAGTVEKLGANVNEFKVGQRVVAYPSLGGYSEHAAAKTTEVRPCRTVLLSRRLRRRRRFSSPPGSALLTDGNLKSGEWLLAQGGSSGVGTAAIQIAKHFGAKVIATTGSERKRGVCASSAPTSPSTSRKTTFARSHARDRQSRRRCCIGNDRRRGLSKESSSACSRRPSLLDRRPFGAIPDTPPNLAEGRKATRFSITNYLKAKPEDFKSSTRFSSSCRKRNSRCPSTRASRWRKPGGPALSRGARHFGKVMLTM